MTSFFSFARNDGLKNLPITIKEDNLYFLENGAKKMETIITLIGNNLRDGMDFDFITIDVDSTGMNLYSEDLPTRIRADKWRAVYNDTNDNVPSFINRGNFDQSFDFKKNTDGTFDIGDKEEIAKSLRSFVDFLQGSPVIAHFSEYPASLIRNLVSVVKNENFSDLGDTSVVFYDVTQIAKIVFGAVGFNTLGMSLDFLCNGTLRNETKVPTNGCENGSSAVKFIIEKVYNLLNSDFSDKVEQFTANGQRQEASISELLQDRKGIISNTTRHVNLLAEIYEQYNTLQAEYEKSFKKCSQYIISLDSKGLSAMEDTTRLAIKKNNDVLLPKYYASYNGQTAVLYIDGQKVEIRTVLGENNEPTDDIKSETVTADDVKKMYEDYSKMIEIRMRLSQLITFFKKLHDKTGYSNFGAGEHKLSVAKEGVKRILARIPDFNTIDTVSKDELFDNMKGGVSFSPILELTFENYKLTKFNRG